MKDALKYEQEVAMYRSIAERVRYENGHVFWVKPNAQKFAGTEVGRKDMYGYLRIHTAKRMVSVHRLIFFMHHGWLPELVDHIDGNNSNNLIENLRPATRLGNSRNCKISKMNKTGIKGVYPAGKKWIASIRINKKITHLGTFPDIFSAACARRSAEIQHYGEFAR